MKQILFYTRSQNISISDRLEKFINSFLFCVPSSCTFHCAPFSLLSNLFIFLFVSVSFSLSLLSVSYFESLAHVPFLSVSLYLIFCFSVSIYIVLSVPQYLDEEVGPEDVKELEGAQQPVEDVVCGEHLPVQTNLNANPVFSANSVLEGVNMITQGQSQHFRQNMCIV